MTFPQGVEALTAMITPTLFLTVTGSLILTSSGRMSRLADRIHELTSRGDDLHRNEAGVDFREERLELVAAQLGTLLWRSDRIRRALTLLYLSLAMFVGTDLVLAMQVLAIGRDSVVATASAVAGVLLLLSASVPLAREAHASLRSNREEAEFYAELCRRRKGAGRGRDAP
jgi:hypothetical protein